LVPRACRTDRLGYLQAPLIVAPFNGKHVDQFLTHWVSMSARSIQEVKVMRIIHQNVAGLDVHKKVVVAAIIVQQTDGTCLSCMLLSFLGFPVK
jgi:hypothetical protein